MSGRVPLATKTNLMHRFARWVKNTAGQNNPFSSLHIAGLCFAVLITNMAWTDTAWADDRNAYMDMVVSYGTRHARAQKDVIYTLHVLTSEDLEKNLPRTLPESLSALPGVLVQKTASGHGSPYIRGFTGNRTLAVIDGIRYNNATYRDGANEYFSHIDTFTLEQIELLSGPAATLYGSEAVGGTLSLKTRDSGYQSEAAHRPFTHGRQVLRLSSGDRSVVSRTEMDMGRGEIWGLRLGLSVKNFGDVRAAKLGRLPHTGYGETAWDVRLDAKLNATWAASLVHQNLSQDDVWRTHSTIFSKPFAGTSIGTDLERLKDQRRQLSYLKLKGLPEHRLVESAEITVSRQSRTETERRVPANGLVIDQSFSSRLWAANAVFESTLSGAQLSYGLDYSFEHIDSDRTDFDPLTNTRTPRIQGPVGDDASYQQTGVFVQGGFSLSDALELEIGSRFSHIRADIGRFEDPFAHNPISFDKGWSDISSSVRVRYKWGNQTRSNIWASVSEAFRAPNIADISRFGRSRSTEFEVASLALKPEKFITGEIGYRFSTQVIRVSASYYYTDMHDYIDTVPTGRIVDGLFEVSKRNSASGHVQGIEIMANIELDAGFSIESHATWLEGNLSRPVSGGIIITEPISRIMPLTGYLALNWTGKNLSGFGQDIWARAELTLAGKADKLSTGDKEDTQRIPVGGTPGYALLNLKSGWHLSDNLQLTLSLNNVLNEAYRTHGSGSNEPGRHVMTGFSLSF
ncbi:MAG: hypothetical protein COA69_07020 [Robiginitomaculum sp.]|nr:MAG: hypothetical protein COA69_07020 [Robiginitomaculum sp.]